MLALRHGVLSKLHSTEPCLDFPLDLQLNFSDAIAELKKFKFFTDKVDLDLTVELNTLGALAASITTHAAGCTERSVYWKTARTDDTV